MRTVVHGDDFVSEGPSEGLQKVRDMLTKHYDIKTEILGDQEGMVKKIKILNRTVC